MHHKQFWNWVIVLVSVAILIVVLGYRHRRGAAGTDYQGTPLPTASSPQPTPDEVAEVQRQAALEAAKEEALRAERRRLAAAERRAQLRRIYDAVTKNEQFDLVVNGLDEWGTTIAIESKDEELMTFQGSARLRGYVPFEDVAVDGRVDEKGRLLISGILPAEAVILDKISAIGVVGGSGWTVERWNTNREERRRKQDETAARLFDQELASYTVTFWNYKQLRARVKSLEPLRERAQIRVDDHAASKATRWIDGDLKSGYTLKAGKTVAIRYANIPKVHAVLFVSREGNWHSKAIEGVRCRINGAGPIGLPTIANSGACLVEFESPIELWELLIETGTGYAGIREIMLLANTVAKPTPKPTEKTRKCRR